MRPTARGVGLAVAIVAVVYLGWTAGPRSLNAVAVPLIVVALAGVVAVGRTRSLDVRRHPVTPGQVGDRRRVDLTVTAGSPTPVTVTDAPGEGLAPADGAPPVIETTVGSGTTIGYDVTLEGRGVHEVGPATVRVRDTFGVVERRFSIDERSSVVVYPPVYELGGGAATDLRALAAAASRRGRGEFDHLREYRRGDPLRDVDWKATARRPGEDPVVAAYTADEAIDRVWIVAEASPGREDGLAAATASVAAHLLSLDVGVSLVAPDRRVDVDPTREGRQRLLDALARVGPGWVADPPTDARLFVRADDDGTVVVLDDREVPFADLRGSRRERLVAGGEPRSDADGELRPEEDGELRSDGSGERRPTNPGDAGPTDSGVVP